MIELLAQNVLKENLQANPGLVWIGLLVWAPVVIWVIMAMRWLIMGEMHFLVAVPSIFAALVLGWFTSNPPVLGMAPFFFFAVLLMMAAIPFITRATEHAAHVQFDVESLEKAYETLKKNPENPGAKLRLARVLHHRGMDRQAVAIGEDALTDLPRKDFPEDHVLVRQWRAGLGSANRGGSVKCPSCGMVNKPADALCARCREPYLLYHARSAWATAPVSGSVMLAWVGAAIILAGIPIVIQAPFALGIRIVVIVAILGFGILAIFSAVTQARRNRRPTE